MTIEIRQLVIRATVEGVQGHASRDLPSAVTVVAPAAAQTPVRTDAIVAACVREVLRQLRRSRER